MWGDYWMMSKFDTRWSASASGSAPIPMHPTTSQHRHRRQGGGSEPDSTLAIQSPEVDKLLAGRRPTLDPAKRKPVYLKMQELTRNDLATAPPLPVHHGAGSQKGELMGFTPNVNVRRTLERRNLVLGNA